MPRAKATESANIPAFQRKRSLSAKARKRPSVATALQRKEAGIPVVKPKRKRRSVRPTLSGFGTSSVSSSSSVSSISSSSDVYARREALKARLAERKAAGSLGSSSSSSSGGGFASLSADENRIKGSNSSGMSGFSAPMVGGDSSYDDSASSDVREMHQCGVVDAFFDSIDVAAVLISSSIRVGDRLVFETQHGLFEQELESMQIDREDVVTAYNGDDVGIKMKATPKKGGNVYKVIN
jgi:hypothetical protein